MSDTSRTIELIIKARADTAAALREIQGQIIKLGAGSPEVQKLSAALDKTTASYARLDGQIARSGGNIAANHRKISEGVGSISEQLENLEGWIGKIAAAGGLTELIAKLGEMGDEFQLANAQITNAIGPLDQFEETQQRLFAIAQNNQVAYKGVVDQFARLAPAIRTITGSSEDALAVVDLFSKAARLSGESQDQAAEQSKRLALALQNTGDNGRVFNSIIEQTPVLAQALAAGLGVPVASLRQLAKEGDLTRQKIVEALLRSKASIDEQAKTLPSTFSGAFTELGNAVGEYIGKGNQALSITQSIASGVKSLAESQTALPLLLDSGTAFIAVRSFQMLKAATIDYYEVARREAADKLSADVAKAAALNAQTIQTVRATELELQLAAALKTSAVSATDAAAAEAIYTESLVASNAAKSGAAAATVRLAAAQTAATVEVSGLSLVMSRFLGFLGGPWGIAITTALTLGALAWQQYGDSAEKALVKPEPALDDLLAKVRQMTSVSDGAIAQSDEHVRALNDLAKQASVTATEIGVLHDTLQKYPEDAQALMLLAGAQERYNRAIGAIGSLSSRLESPAKAELDQYLEQFKTEREKLDQKIRNYRDRATGAGVTEGSSEDLGNIAKISRDYMDKVGAAHAAMITTIAQADAALAQSAAGRAKSELDARLKANQISIQDYYAQVLAIEQQASQAQSRATRAQLTAVRAAPVRDAADADRKRGQEYALQSQLKDLDQQRVSLAKQLNAERDRGLRDLDVRIGEVKARIAELTGDASDPGRKKIAADYQQLLEQVEKSRPESAEMIRRALGLEEAKADVDIIEERIKRIYAELQNRQVTIQTDVQTGHSNPNTARADLRTANAKAIDDLRKARDDLSAKLTKATAEGLDTTSIIHSLDDVQKHIDELADTPLQKLLRSWQDTTGEMEQAWATWMQRGSDELTKFLTTGQGDFRSFIASIGTDIVRMQLNNTLGQLFGGSGGSPLSSISSGLSSVWSWATSSKASTASGDDKAASDLSKSADDLTGSANISSTVARLWQAISGIFQTTTTTATVSSASQLTAAAYSLSAAAYELTSAAASMAGSAAGSAAGSGATLVAATGGLIAGPGSDTSDNIPAWLSPGEYVVNAKAVRRLGRTMLDRINASGSSPSQKIQKFADGGYVASSPGAAISGGSGMAVKLGDMHFNVANDGGDFDAKKAQQLKATLEGVVRQELVNQRRPGGILGPGGGGV
jgi:tape measure domain-containing protein